MRNENRKGAAVVEFALVLPIFVALLLGLVEMGRGWHVKQVLINAAREGARRASVGTVSPSIIKDTVENYLEETNIPTTGLSVTMVPTVPVKDEPVTVTVTLPYSSVNWVPIQFLSGEKLTASSTFAREETAH